jgi:hypothetical protein
MQYAYPASRFLRQARGRATSLFGFFVLMTCIVSFFLLSLQMIKNEEKWDGKCVDVGGSMFRVRLPVVVSRVSSRRR